MGDRYLIENKCPYCGNVDEVYYAPSCGCLTHICTKCKNEYIIIMKFVGQKATKEEIDKMYEENGFVSVDDKLPLLMKKEKDEEV